MSHLPSKSNSFFFQNSTALVSCSISEFLLPLPPFSRSLTSYRPLFPTLLSSPLLGKSLPLSLRSPLILRIFSSFPVFQVTSLSLILAPSISTFVLVFYILSVSLSIFRSQRHPLPHDFSLFFSCRFRFFLFSSTFSHFCFFLFRRFGIFSFSPVTLLRFHRYPHLVSSFVSSFFPHNFSSLQRYSLSLSRYFFSPPIVLPLHSSPPFQILSNLFSQFSSHPRSHSLSLSLHLPRNLFFFRRCSLALLILLSLPYSRNLTPNFSLLSLSFTASAQIVLYRISSSAQSSFTVISSSPSSISAFRFLPFHLPAYLSSLSLVTTHSPFFRCIFPKSSLHFPPSFSFSISPQFLFPISSSSLILISLF